MRRLTLKRETIRMLTSDHLRAVWGGKAMLELTDTCSGEICTVAQSCDHTNLECPSGPTDNPTVCVTGAVSNCRAC